MPGPAPPKKPVDTLGMTTKHHKLAWTEQHGPETFKCSLDVAMHPAKSSIILLTMSGVEGSADGYQGKYVTIAQNAQREHGVAAVRIGNPFISSLSWESNLRHTLDYVIARSAEIAGPEFKEIRIMAHSAGGTVAGLMAWEYPEVSRLLLVNPALKHGYQQVEDGLRKFRGSTTVLFGEHDSSIFLGQELGKLPRVQVLNVKDADHHFSGDAIHAFINASSQYLFDSKEQ